MTLDFSSNTRQANLHSPQQFDILVVGGGITGAGIARDAAMRGFKTALIDKGDFASGTSSKSSRLVHGGIRYLEMFQFGLVFEASRERRVLWNIIPHLATPLPFLFPVYRDTTWHPQVINLGLWMYDALALFRNYRNHEWLSNDEIARRANGIDCTNINGGAYYYDGQVDDARLTLETIRSAHRHGASIANYVRVDELIKEGNRVIGVRAHDVLSGDKVEIRARVVVNATGVWTDTLTQLDDPGSPKRMRPTKGIHIIVPRALRKVGGDSAVAFPNIADGRLLFAIPWGNFQIIGTTDTDYTDDYDHVHADAADVDYVIAATNHAFPATPLTRADVISTYAGLRPLICQAGKSASQTSREHEIWTSASGLVSIAGGKLTTYRSMAEQCVNVVAQQLRDQFNVVAKRKCQTAKIPIVEGNDDTPNNDLPRDVVEHLIHFHGPEAGRVIEITKRDPKLVRRICDDLPYIWAEIPYAIEQEMALTVTDVLERRLHLLTETRGNGLTVAPRVAEMMRDYFHWDTRRIEQELRAYQERVRLTNAFRN
jgi:glycerol-3-phosphate dehydrogenase